MATLAVDPLGMNNEDEADDGITILPPSIASDPSYMQTVEVDSIVAQINIEAIPVGTRMDLLRSAIQNYVTNRVSTAKSVVKKKNEAFDIYEAATANDPLQSLVARPDGERETLDAVAVMTTGINALYEGKFGRRAGEGRKSKPQRDPLITQITRAVVQEVYQKGKEADPQYKYPMAAKQVGSDGLAYLKARLAEKVAAGADPKLLNDFLETRYIKPAKAILGQTELAPRFKDMEGIL